MSEFVICVRADSQRPHGGDVSVSDRVGPVADFRRATRAQLRARTFYMLGAYLRVPVRAWLAPAPEGFWFAALGAALAIALLGGIVERALLRHLYSKEELYQLLFTYALVLILGDAGQDRLGHAAESVSRPPSLAGAPRSSAPPSPTTTCSSWCSVRPSPSASGTSCSVRRRAALCGRPRSIARCSARSASTSERALHRHVHDGRRFSPGSGAPW